MTELNPLLVLPTEAKVNIGYLRTKKASGVPITMLTAYDYPTASVIDESGIDAMLVGDSLAMVVLGHENTLAISMDRMIYHCQAVSRGTKRSFLIGDMPFLSYQVSVKEAIINAGRFIKEGGMDAVKLEGGRERIETIRGIVVSGIPVMGHIGLMPQSIHQQGGYGPQGRDAVSGKRLVDDAAFLEEAGCFGIVLESIPAKLAGYITRKLSIPTIGIGAGNECDGQILVTHDLLGLFDKFTPKFVKRYANLNIEMKIAFQNYISEVKNRGFPCKEHTIEMSRVEWEKFLNAHNEDNS